MSDNTLTPIPDTDLSIIERSVVMNFRQPVHAAKNMMNLLRKLNAALGRVAELEKQVAELKATKADKPPEKSTAKPPSPTSSPKPSSNTPDVV